MSVEILRRWEGDGECYVEIARAVEHLTRGTDQHVVFNANHLPAPTGSIVYNLDLVGVHFADPGQWRGHEVWDFSPRNMGFYPLDMLVKYAPVGYHKSMSTFDSTQVVKDIDVVLCGGMNERRASVMRGIEDHGYRVVHNSSVFGAERDKLLARSRLAINMLYYETGVFPVLRAAHCAANNVAFLSEKCAEMPAWCGLNVPYKSLVSAAVDILSVKPFIMQASASQTRMLFERFPMVLP